MSIRYSVAVAVIGVVTDGLTFCGMLFGSLVGQRSSLGVRVLDGVILIGIKILAERTLFQSNGHPTELARKNRR